MSDQGRRGPEFRASSPPATRGRAQEETYVRRFFALCSGELSGFSAPPAPPDASALDVVMVPNFMVLGRGAVSERRIAFDDL